MPECHVCLEQVARNHTVSIESSPVCHDCVRQMFEAAITDEDRYPPKWGHRILKPEDFSRIVPRLVRKQLTEKEKEYLTPPMLRIYCKNTVPTFAELSHPLSRRQLPPCTVFVGKLVEDVQKSMAAGAVLCGECGKCGTKHCLICGDVYMLGGHQCKKFSPKDADDQAFVGLTKGKEYQICPSTTCQRKLELMDGCNHVTCKCGQHFCFICGEPATNDHWTRSREEVRCPVYSHPSRPNAIYENEPDDIGPGLLEHFDPLARAQDNRRGVHHQRRNAIFALPPFAVQLGAQRDDRDRDSAMEVRAAVPAVAPAMFNGRILDANALMRADRAIPLDWVRQGSAPHDIDRALQGHIDPTVQQPANGAVAHNGTPRPSKFGPVPTPSFLPPNLEFARANLGRRGVGIMAPQIERPRLRPAQIQGRQNLDRNWGWPVDNEQVDGGAERTQAFGSPMQPFETTYELARPPADRQQYLQGFTTRQNNTGPYSRPRTHLPSNRPMGSHPHSSRQVSQAMGFGRINYTRDDDAEMPDAEFGEGLASMRTGEQPFGGWSGSGSHP